MVSYPTGRPPYSSSQALKISFRALWSLLTALGLLSCRGGNPPPPVVMPTAPAPASQAVNQRSTTPPPASPPQAVSQQPTAPPPASSTPPPTAAVKAAPQQTSPQLPNALLREWQPMSKVLLTFGAMTLTPTQIQWASGQVSPYSVVNQQGGVLLKLEANPKFYDSANAYLKLIPQTNESGSITGVDAAFYQSEAQLQKDEYVMYGSYFAQ